MGSPASPDSPGSLEELDPDIAEELEFWGGPGDDDDGGDADDDDDHADADADADRSEAAGPADNGAGALVLVGTPIGNLGDLAPRAIELLGRADVIYCEDTRHSRKLLTHAGITGSHLRSLHGHNEDDRIDEIVRAVGEGRTAALVSDAGMPGVSDPGSRVVAAVAGAGLVVSVVPGPSAVLAALVASGLATDRFCFEGFLPRSGKERRHRLSALAVESRTTVLFEAPGRVAGTLADLAEVCGGHRPVAVARELTKLHEEIWRGCLADAVLWAREGPVRGEVVLVVAGAEPAGPVVVSDDVLRSALGGRLASGERTRGVVDEVAATFGVPRRRVYELALAEQQPPASPPSPSSPPSPDGDG